MNSISLAQTLKREALTLGFDVVGISRVSEDRPSLQPQTSNLQPSPSITPLLLGRLSEWLRRGYHATMTWLARAPERRADPAQVLPDCRSIISVGMNYYTGYRPDERPGNGRIARYAWGEDYHHVLLPRLEQLASRLHALAPEARTRCYADTGPIMEKAWAERAGLGWIGKHSNLVSPRFGSWLLLGEILTTLDLVPDEPGSDLCGSCTLCIKACPTGAIVEPYVVDAGRCISYLTIELHKPGDTVPEELARRMGNRIFGCDDCLDVCPYNVEATPTTDPAFQPSAMTLGPPLEVFVGFSEDRFTRTFPKSPIRRARIHGFLRNVRIALRNLTSRGLSPTVSSR